MNPPLKFFAYATGVYCMFTAITCSEKETKDRYSVSEARVRWLRLKTFRNSRAINFSEKYAVTVEAISSLPSQNKK